MVPLILPDYYLEILLQSMRLEHSVIPVGYWIYYSIPELTIGGNAALE